MIDLPICSVTTPHEQHTTPLPNGGALVCFGKPGKLRADTALTAEQEIRARALDIAVAAFAPRVESTISEMVEIRLTVAGDFAAWIEHGDPGLEDACAERCPNSRDAYDRRLQVANTARQAAEEVIAGLQATVRQIAEQRDAVLTMCDEIDRHERGSLDEKEVRAILGDSPVERAEVTDGE